MIAFEVFTGRTTRRFDSFLKATFYFVSQPQAYLVLETRHAEPGPGGSYVSREVLAVRNNEDMCTPPLPFRVSGGMGGEG